MDSDNPALKNRGGWNDLSDEYQAEHKDSLGKAPTAWGIWRIPETELNVLGDVAGLDVLELGCGAAQWSTALAGQGVRVVGLDLSDRQLGHARRLAADKGASFPLVQASAESVPFAADSFDVVFCDHGGMSFARPERTVAEAARVLRPGGLLAFCIASPLLDVCWDPSQEAVSDRLHDSYFDLYQVEDGPRVTYQLPLGEWIRLFRRHSLIVEDLIEIRPPEDASTTYQDYVTLDWARRWPAENVWKLRRAAT
jgi:SAM-dependent methyltransferase